MAKLRPNLANIFTEHVRAKCVMPTVAVESELRVGSFVAELLLDAREIVDTLCTGLTTLLQVTMSRQARVSLKLIKKLDAQVGWTCSN